MSPRRILAAMLMAVFLVSAAIGGFCIAPAVGFFCLAGASITTSLIIGWAS